MLGTIIGTVAIYTVGKSDGKKSRHHHHSHKKNYVKREVVTTTQSSTPIKPINKAQEAPKPEELKKTAEANVNNETLTKVQELLKDPKSMELLKAFIGMAEAIDTAAELAANTTAENVTTETEAPKPEAEVIDLGETKPDEIVEAAEVETSSTEQPIAEETPTETTEVIETATEETVKATPETDDLIDIGDLGEEPEPVETATEQAANTTAENVTTETPKKRRRKATTTASNE